jgi:hypothetical protein
LVRWVSVDLYVSIAAAAVISSGIAAFVARRLRLPWWGILLAAVVAWFGLAIHLAVWEVPGSGMILTCAKLVVLPTITGSGYAVVTRGVIGPPEGPLPRSK